MTNIYENPLRTRWEPAEKMDSVLYEINWTGTWEEYVWKTDIHHHAIPPFDGYAAVKEGNHPQYIQLHPHAYGCFSDGSGRNFYGAHVLGIRKK